MIQHYFIGLILAGPIKKATLTNIKNRTIVRIGLALHNLQTL